MLKINVNGDLEDENGNTLLENNEANSVALEKIEEYIGYVKEALLELEEKSDLVDDEVKNLRDEIELNKKFFLND